MEHGGYSTTLCSVPAVKCCAVGALRQCGCSVPLVPALGVRSLVNGSGCL